MNIDFQADPGFSAYVVLLMISGIAMIVMASPTVKGATPWLRALNGLFGVGFLGYGFYLAFLFQGGGYFIIFKAFILPVVLIVRTISSARARSRQQSAQAAHPVPTEQTSWPATPQASPWAPPAHDEQSAQA